MDTISGGAGRGYLFRRAYFLAALVAWAMGFFYVSQCIRDGGFPFLLPFLMLFVIPAVLWALSVGAFPLRYSALGACRRTRMPETIPLREWRNSGGRIGWLRATAPFFTWSVHRDGLGLRILGAGEAFVPRETIRRVGRGPSSPVEHTFEEVRSPVRVPAAVAGLLRKVVEDPESIPPPPPGRYVREFNLVPWLLLLPVAVICAGFGFGYVYERTCEEARLEVLEFLARAGPGAEITVISGAPWRGENAERLLGALTAMERSQPHHSHPGRGFLVTVRRGDGTMELELARDSNDSTENWVYRPDRGWMTDYNEIGRIHTGCLGHIPSTGSRAPRRGR